MNINIELENKDRCDGCPLLKIGNIGENSYCRLLGLAVFREEVSFNPLVFRHNRPARCIEENGE